MEQDLKKAEESLQEWLWLKPRPFYVERAFCRPKSPNSLFFWENVLKQLDSTNSDSLMLLDAVKSSTVHFTLLMNHYTCFQYFPMLSRAVDFAKVAVQKAQGSGMLTEQAKAQDCLAYALTERAVIYSEMVEPQTQLFYDTPAIAEALEACKQSLSLGVKLDDRFIIHRTTYNLGRINQDVATKSSFDYAYHYFLTSFSQLEVYRAFNGDPSEPYWQKRRAEVLHRLVELCTFEKAGRIEINNMLYGFFEISQQLKDPALANVVINRPVFSTTLDESMVWQLIVYKDNKKIPLPMVFNYQKIQARLDDDTAILDFVIADRFVIFTLIRKTCISQRIFNPDTIALGGWSRYFRPTNIDIRSAFKDFPGGKSGLSWEFSLPFVKLTPENIYFWDIHEEEYVSFYHPNVRWQQALYNIIFQHLDEQLIQLGIKHIIIIPDGALSLLPFQILKDKDDFLVDKFTISYAPNLSIVAESLITPKPKAPESILIIKDPTNSLVFSEVEVAQIAQLFPPDKVTILDHMSATKDNITQAAAGVDIIHFSTHGFFDSENPSQSGLLIKDGKWLTLADIKEIKVRNGALVFLSACDTARLKLSSRFYSIGVCPSFLQAGAATVVSTFWKVNDMSAAKISSCFYENLVESHLSRLESLRKAIEYVRQNEKADAATQMSDDDYYTWGAFSLYGSWK